MPVLICGTEKNSIAERSGIEAGTILHSINGHEINDVLDFRFYEAAKNIELLLEKGGEKKKLKVKKDEYDSLGLCFETYLMDKQRSCKNKCVFCFIDQLPKGMRESLYFKDDDSRLSFLFGNYITLTNLTQHDIDRIKEMHISPVNISIHTMEPKLRVSMMRNPNAGSSLDFLRQLAQAGISINCQLVLCPEINDGGHLAFSLEKIIELGEAVRSVAIVPVGLTKHREGLYPLRLFNSDEAKEVIKTAEKYADICLRKFGRRLVHAADELYIKAGIELPDEEYYEEFEQLENGVGLVTLLQSEFDSAVKNTDADDRERKVTIATGVSAAPIISGLLDRNMSKWKNVKYAVFPIKNEFFGESITVAGLVTGKDLITQLKGKEIGDELLIPRVMLRREGDMFLDDVTLDDVERELNVKVRPVANDGWELLDAVLGEEVQ